VGGVAVVMATPPEPGEPVETEAGENGHGSDDELRGAIEADLEELEAGDDGNGMAVDELSDDV
jgi:hypothetical protein